MSTARNAVRAALVVALATGVAPLSAGVAVAVPPDNDDFDTARVVSTVPFTDTVDTTEATSAADDPEPECVGTGRTVWYSFTPSTNARVAADTFGSDYDTTLSVYTGSRGDLTELACNDDAESLQSRVTFDAVAGETYFLMAGSFFAEPSGVLVFNLGEAPPALELAVSVDPFGAVEPSSGRVELRGTVTCSRPASAELFGRLQQRAGRVTISGFFGTFLECDGVTPWSFELVGDNGRFAGGRATAQLESFAFSDDGESAFVSVETTVRLRGKR